MTDKIATSIGGIVARVYDETLRDGAVGQLMTKGSGIAIMFAMQRAAEEALAMAPSLSELDRLRSSNEAMLSALKRLTDYSRKPTQADWQAADEAVAKAEGQAARAALSLQEEEAR